MNSHIGAPRPTTIAALVRARADDQHPGLRFEDEVWTYAELVQAAAERAAAMRALRRAGPFHVGVLLDNVPEYNLWLSAAALVGATVVGINPTRRGAELARDITHTDCQFIVTDTAYRALLDGLDLRLAPERVLSVDAPAYAALLAAHRGAPLPDVELRPEDRFLLLFTSGTSATPKACICSQGRLARAGVVLAATQQLGPTDVCYQAMPLFHSNALFVGYAPAWASGATHAYRRTFSASGFLPDVRRYGATFANYVGKALAYVLATPARPDDADNPLRRVFGNEAADLDIARFATRFGCAVTDGYGSTEGAATITRRPEMPPGALGWAPEGHCIVDPDTLAECPPAEFDADGRLLNPDTCIGEIVNKQGAAHFEGYYDSDDANAARVRGGWYWTGDLGYRDRDGWFYFAGRDFDWLRVDGENFAAAPIERILARYPDVALAGVYAVPDEHVGDQVMACLELRPGAAFDAAAFAAFLAAQPDLGTKMAPRYVRITPRWPVTQSHKLLKRALRRDAWECADPVWWRPAKDAAYRPMTDGDRRALRARFAARGRLAALDAGRPGDRPGH